MFKPPPPENLNPQYLCVAEGCNSLATTIAPYNGQWYRSCGAAHAGAVKPRSKPLTEALSADDLDFIGNQIYVVGSVSVPADDHGVTSYPSAAQVFLQKMFESGYILTKIPK